MEGQCSSLRGDGGGRGKPLPRGVNRFLSRPSLSCRRCSSQNLPQPDQIQDVDGAVTVQVRCGLVKGLSARESDRLRAIYN